MAPRGWSELPRELLEMIVKYLTFYIDYIRFLAVCTSWRAAAPKRPLNLPSEDHFLTTRAFFIPSENNFYSLSLPESSRKKRRCFGSSLGWCFILKESTDMYLWNPLTGDRHYLPSFTNFPNVLAFDDSRVGEEFLIRISERHEATWSQRRMRDEFITKAVLSSDHSSLDADFNIVATLYYGELAFIKKDMEGWTLAVDPKALWEDVVFYNGVFYAINSLGFIAACNVDGNLPTLVLITVVPTMADQRNTSKSRKKDKLYLVESCGELFVIRRLVRLGFSEGHRTVRFEVYKVDLNNPNVEPVNDLGGRFLLLGDRCCLVLSVDEYHGCKENCIYFGDNYIDGYIGVHDIRVFNITDGSLEPLTCFPGVPRCIKPPPIWETPNPF